MTSGTHHSHDDEMSSRVHHARHAVTPAVLIAATLTVFYREGLAFLLGAVAAWLLVMLFVSFQAGHEWDTCSHCTQPPKHLATEAARARLARFAHRRRRRLTGQLLMLATLTAALAPKDYLDHWWGKAGAAVLYAVTALWLTYSTTRFVQHENYREECHNERCRANVKRPRRFSVWLGHYGLWFLIVLVPANAALGMMALHQGRLYNIAYAVGLLAIADLTGCLIFTHLDTPCVRCARHLPIDAEEQAERKSRWLKAHHRLHYWLPGLAFGAWVTSWTVAGTPAGRIMVACAVALLLPWAALIRVHGRLQPWCPWCRDNGGENAAEDAPDPSRNQPAPV